MVREVKVHAKWIANRQKWTWKKISEVYLSDYWIDDSRLENLFGGIDDIPVETLVSVLQYHVVPGNVRSTDLTEGDVASLNGNINISLAGSVMINEVSNVSAVDIQGTNGVVHVIDKVLLP